MDPRTPAGEDPPRAAAEMPAPGLDRLRALYLAAVEDDEAIERGLEEVERLREGSAAGRGGARAGLLSAYAGALETLRAKHALWPPAKLRHLRQGLEVLDRAVEEHPEVAEIRYLRLMSCYYLPGVLGRRGSVREDFAALARLLPDARDEYPPDAYQAVVRFVLEEGTPSPDARERLERALERADG